MLPQATPNLFESASRDAQEEFMALLETKKINYRGEIAIYAAALILGVIGCGHADFHGTPSVSQTADAVPLNINWALNCDGTHVTQPKASDTQIVLEGEGPHQMDAQKIQGASVVIAGSVCPGTSHG